MAGAGTEGVNLRAEPSTSGARLKVLRDGTLLEIVGEDRQADGRTWRNVKDPADAAVGWIAADFLAAGDATPPPAAEKPAAPVPAPTAIPKPAAPAQPTAAPKPAPAAPSKPAPGSGTIVCNDGYVWPSSTRQGACSRHGGIAPGY